MSKKDVLICIDRDGTLIFDDKYHLGRTNNWKELVKILPGVIDGIKILNKISKSHIVLITNQPGIAIKEFPLLTKERANEVCEYVVNEIKKQGGIVHDFIVCPHPSPKYASDKDQYTYIESEICNCSCIKPDTGMIIDSLTKFGLDKDNTSIYMIGDRLSDIEVGIKAGGKSVFVPFSNEIQELEKVKEKKFSENLLKVANNFRDGAEWIYDLEKSK